MMDSRLEEMDRAGKGGHWHCVWWKGWALWILQLVMTRVESLRVRIKGQANKGDVTVGVYY